MNYSLLTVRCANCKEVLVQLKADSSICGLVADLLAKLSIQRHAPKHADPLSPKSTAVTVNVEIKPDLLAD